MGRAHGWEVENASAEEIAYLEKWAGVRSPERAGIDPQATTALTIVVGLPGRGTYGDVARRMLERNDA